jgi:hypothetical protein
MSLKWSTRLAILACSLECLVVAQTPEHASTTNLPPAARNWGPETNGLRLSLSFSKSTFQSGEGIVATVLTTNVGSVPLQVSDTSMGNFRFTISGPAGQQVPLTPAAQRAQHGLIASWDTERPIRANGFLKEEENLSETWEMSKPGRYRITAIRPVSRPNWMELKAKGVPLKERFAYVTSNTVEIEVTGRTKAATSR